MNRKVHAGFGPADEGSTVKKLTASTSSDWYSHISYENGQVYIPPPGLDLWIYTVIARAILGEQRGQKKGGSEFWLW